MKRGRPRQRLLLILEFVESLRPSSGQRRVPNNVTGVHLTNVTGRKPLVFSGFGAFEAAPLYKVHAPTTIPAFMAFIAFMACKQQLTIPRGLTKLIPLAVGAFGIQGAVDCRRSLPLAQKQWRNETVGRLPSSPSSPSWEPWRVQEAFGGTREP